MLKLIIKQANWGILGSMFGFLIGFVIKIYLIDIVGVDAWGKYVSAHSFASFADTLLALGIPWVIIKYMPNYIEHKISDAKQFMRKVMYYTISISFLFIFLMWLLAPWFDNYVYIEIEEFSLILLLVSIHAPISILTGIITALYRSIFKIKQIVIYGTFLTVPLRAVLTYFVFKYTDNIMYFIVIELFTTFLTFLVLSYLFNKNEMSFIHIERDRSYRIGHDVISYGKKMYANSLVAFFAAQSLSLIISIKLSPEQIGAYSILLTVTGVTMFIIKNLNKIFAPAISKLYEQGKTSELNSLYKQTTFIVNLLTMPFTILIIVFANDILFLYDDSGSLSEYLVYLYIIMGARIISLLAGSSGTFMMMAGLEKQELILQLIKAIFMTLFAIILINKYGLFAMVVLFVLFMLFLNIGQLVLIYKNIGISPFSNSLYLLIFISTPIIYFAITYPMEFGILHYIFIPVFLYLFYFLIFLKKIKYIYLDTFKND